MNYQSTESVALADLVTKIAKVIAPPPKLTVSQWADSERRLSKESSAEAGKWRTDRAPYQRGMMDAVNERGVHTVVLMTSAQVGKSECLNNIVGYFVDYDPCPIMFMQPILDLAEAYSKDRLAPMFRDTPALRNKIKDPRSRDSDNTLLHKKFPGGHITLAGANSAANLSSRPIRVVLCDEVDRYPASAGSEGDPVSLASKRTTTFYNRKRVLTSTPTVKDRSRIETAFGESDQRRYFVPCTECGEYQTLKWASVKWENEDSSSAVYMCEHCDEPIDESRKLWMLRRGEWRATAPFSGTAGFHINEIYSPWRTLSDIVSDFLKAKKNPEMLKTWINTALGETWEEKGDAPEWERLYDRREKYPRNKPVRDIVFLTAGVDVQGDRIEAEVVGWGKDKQSWSIDHRVFPGNTATDAPWIELSALLEEEWPHPSGMFMKIVAMGVDSGFNTQHVYNWARQHSPMRVFALKGSDRSQVLLGKPSQVDLTVQGKKMTKGFRVWPAGVSVAKSELYSFLRLPSPVDGEDYPPGYCHFPEYESEYFKQLTAEQLVRRVVKGYPKYEWEKTRSRNEAIDMRVYARVAAYAFGMDRFTDRQWENLQTDLGSSRVPKSRKPFSSAAVPPSAKKKRSSFWD